MRIQVSSVRTGVSLLKAMRGWLLILFRGTIMAQSHHPILVEVRSYAPFLYETRGE
jgi:hypothetical protein